MISPTDKSIVSVLAGRAESYRLEDSLTPRAEIAAGIAAVVNAWNECIPRERVRVMSVGRVINVRCLLHRFTVEEVLRAIRCYGQAAWQRQHNAWKRFDNAMSESFVVDWLEEAMKADEVAEAVEDRKRRAAEEDAETRRRADAENEAWKALTPAEVEALVAEAKAQLGAAAPMLMTNFRRTLAYARELWKKKRKEATP